MIVLSVETSSVLGSLSLIKDEKILITKKWSRVEVPGEDILPLKQSHSEVLTDIFLKALDEVQIDMKDIDLLTTTMGPGSFTGIRVGVNFVKTLGYSLDKKIFALNSLDTMAASFSKSDQPLYVFINAYKNMVFWNKYLWVNDSWKPQQEAAVDEVLKLEEKIQEPGHCIGDGYQVYERIIPSELKNRLDWNPELDLYPSSEVSGLLASESSPLGQTIGWKELAALYLRPSAAEEKQGQGLLKTLSKIN